MDELEFRRILRKYRSGDASGDEQKIVNAWYDASQREELAHEQRLSDELGIAYLKNITNRIGKSKRIPRSRTREIKLISFVVGIAASILLTIWFGGSFIQSREATHQIAVNPPTDVWEIRINSQETSQAVRLPDGSNVILEPHSTIKYQTGFKGSDREVYLDGEGYFDVVHNERKPFLVHAKQLTAKVLGTSFTVRAFQADREVVVAVKTGRVSVNTGAADHRTTPAQIILTPNTEVIYNPDDGRVAKRIVATPLPIVSSEEVRRMRFMDAPLKVVFDAIEKVYGVDLVFDEGTFASCVLTTSISDGGIYKRLDIICNAIGAEYNVVEDKIVISGTGCN